MTVDSEDDALKIVQAEDGRIGISLFAQIIPHGLSSDVTTMSAGTYFLSSTSDYVFELEIPGHKGFQVNTTKPIDYKYLPKALQFGERSDLIFRWDGDTTGLDQLKFFIDSALYRITDTAITMDELENGCFVTLSTEPGVEGHFDTSDIRANANGFITVGSVIYIAPRDLQQGSQIYKQGIYVYKDSSGFVSSVRIPNISLTKMDEEYLPASVDGVVIRSSTEGSTKKFRITVDDSGTISATEVI